MELPQHDPKGKRTGYYAAHQVAPSQKIAISELSDDYPVIVARLDAKTRVIECAAGIQWIVQRRQRAGRYSWESVYFCRTKAGLLRFAPSPKLLQLPEYFRAWHDLPAESAGVAS